MAGAFRPLRAVASSVSLAALPAGHSGCFLQYFLKSLFFALVMRLSPSGGLQGCDCLLKAIWVLSARGHVLRKEVMPMKRFCEAMPPGQCWPM